MASSLLWICILLHVVKSEVCTEMTHNVCYCNGRNLSYIPDVNAETQILDFSFNYLPSLNQSFFPQLLDLKHLDLTRCQIHHIDENAFQHVRGIATLILTGNPIAYTSNSTFSELHQLQRLVLVDTGLFSIADVRMCHMTNLQELNVGTNRLLSISIPACFSKFKDFRKLDLHANNISVIRRDHTAVLGRMQNNITIILSRNPILHIETGAFRNIYLQELELRNAFVSCNASKDGLKALVGLTVEKLVLGRYYGDRASRVDDVHGSLAGLCLINFKEINLRQKEWTGRILPLFDCMSNATKVTINQGRTSFMESIQLRKTKELIITKSDIRVMPTEQLSHHHTLEKLTITESKNPIVFDYGFCDMPSLKYVDVSNNQLVTKKSWQLLFQETPNIQYLNMSFNSEANFDFKGLQGFRNLEVLDFHRTKISCVREYVDMTDLNRLQYLDLSYTGSTFTHPLSFQGLGNLRVLKMSSSLFLGDVLKHLFVNLTQLEMLDVSFSSIEHLPLESFGNLKQLTQLIASGNKLMSVDFLTNPSLLSLIRLDAAENHISAIPDNVLRNLPKTLQTLDISFNPVDCSCSQASFIVWIQNHKNIMKNWHDTYCRSDSTSTKPRVHDFDSEYCTHVVTGKILGSIFAVVFLLAASALVYKFQFHCFVLLKGYTTSQQTECHYDAFVIYSSKDESWVTGELVENLEKGVPPVQLCLYERDFEVGRSITSSIIEDGIMGSRKVIVVVSRHFVDSTWCRFEFEIAQSWQLLGGGSNIIIIMLEDVEKEMSRRVFGLHRYLRRNTYLEWKDNPISKVRFWTRLRKAVISKTET
ncbi:toll-like receptor 4 [Myripristis murdjan]|nr:toll-like receptor 4 [Myripristis murdjan]